MSLSSLIAQVSATEARDILCECISPIDTKSIDKNPIASVMFKSQDLNFISLRDILSRNVDLIASKVANDTCTLLSLLQDIKDEVILYDYIQILKGRTNILTIYLEDRNVGKSCIINLNDYIFKLQKRIEIHDSYICTIC